MTTAGRRRVVFLDHTATPGGGQLSALRLLPKLTNIRPTAVYLTGGPLEAEIRAQGIDTQVLTDHSGVSYRNIPGIASRLASYLREQQPGVPVVALSTTTAQVLGLVRRRQYRLLRLSEDMERYQHRGIKSFLYFRWIFPRFDGYISNSIWTASTIPHSLSFIPTNLAYPLSGIDTDNPRVKPPFSSPRVTMACFSRPAAWKGIDIAITAIHQLAAKGIDAELSIYGGDWQATEGYLTELKALAGAGPGRISFHGHTSDVSGVMRSTDVVILPSRLPEPYGQVTVQALAAGCLTVVSNHGGSLELVDDGRTGLVFNNEDAKDLARVLFAAHAAAEHSQQIAAAGREAALELGDESLAPKFEATILELLP